MSSPIISDKVERALRDIGLTEYETLAYLSLLRSGELTAENVSEASSIPYSKVYSVLENLRERDWIEIEGGRPRRYYPRSPEDALRSEQLRLESEFEGNRDTIVQELQPMFEQKEIREVMVFLQGHEVSPAYAVKIFKAYGDKAISVVKENPYRLALDISGIGFKTADKIARSMGIDPDSQIRAEAGLIHILSELVDEGHIYYPYEELKEKVSVLLEVDKAILDAALATVYQFQFTELVQIACKR